MRVRDGKEAAMILIDSEQRPVEDQRGRWWVWGIAEDGGRRFVYLIDKATGKHYIEEALTHFNLAGNNIRSELRWIKDEQLHQDLVKFFHENVHMKNILEHNKKMLDKGIGGIK